MSIFRKAFWQDTDTPRWQLVSGALLTIVLSALFGYFTSINLQDSGRIADNRVQHSQALIESMTQFQIYVSAFSSEMASDGTVKTATRTTLIRNLNEQYARIRTVSNLVPDTTIPALDAYREKISKMIVAVNDAKDIKSMKQFWSAASDLLVARNEVNIELKKSI